MAVALLVWPAWNSSLQAAHLFGPAEQRQRDGGATEAVWTLMRWQAVRVTTSVGV